jgi:hypothetical protein
MRLGLVDPKRLQRRRTNPRKMSDAEYATLQQSMAKFGFKSFILVEEIKPGTYGVVDGHHRWQAAMEMKLPHVPVVLLDESAQGTWTDLAMLTFNVTGSPVDDIYVDLLAELTSKLGADVAGAFTAVDPDFLANFAKDMDAMQDASQPPAAGPEGAEKSRGGTWHGKALVVEFARTDEIEALMARVTLLTGQPVLSSAILAALREWSAVQQTTTPTQADGEEN